MGTFLLSLLLVSLGVAYTVVSAIKLKRLTSKSCSAMIENLHDVSMEGICFLAKPATLEDDPESVNARELIDLLGGSGGLIRLRQNAEAMLEIARYLSVMSPDASLLVDSVRGNAYIVRKLSTILVWQQRTGLGRLSSRDTVRLLAKHYISMSVNTMAVCLDVVDEVLPLVRKVQESQSQTQVSRSASLLLTGERFGH